MWGYSSQEDLNMPVTTKDKNFEHHTYLTPEYKIYLIQNSNLINIYEP